MTSRNAAKVKELKQKVRKLKSDLRYQTNMAAEAASEEVARDMQRRVVEQNAVWRTDLYRNIDVDKQQKIDSMRFTITADVPYAAMVEFGTGQSQDADTPPEFMFDSPDMSAGLVNEITEWVMTKPAFYGPRTTDVVWAIAKSISEEGTDPHPFMRPAWFKGETRVIGRVENAVDRVIRRA